MGIDSPYCVYCATREKIDFSRIFLWSERKVALDMRATFLYRVFVCFVLEVLLYFFFIPRLYFLLLPYAACCVLCTLYCHPSVFVYTVQRPAVQCSSSFFAKIWWSEDLSGDKFIYSL